MKPFCLLALSVLAAACGPASDRPATDRPDVLVYLIDTLRADHLGCYGSSRGATPSLDAFARESALFEDAMAQSGWTRPAVTSILTGLDPRSHGVQQRLHKVPGRLELLPEMLHREGYQTAAFISSAVVTAQFGFDQGFDVFHQEVKEAIEATRPTSEWVGEQAEAWLARRDPGRPFFLYLHTLDPHMPYTPPERFRRRLAPGIDPRTGSTDHVVALRDGRTPPSSRDRDDLAALYDAEIAANDAAFGRLLDRLKAMGLADRLLVVLVADHGEEFLDHGGWEHGASLYQELLHVPLIVRAPDGLGAGRRIADPVRQVDLLPTILEILGIHRPPGLDGRSLVPLLHGNSLPGVPGVAALDLDGRRIEAVQIGPEKLLLTLAHDRRPTGIELYDLSADPAERHNLAPERPDDVRRLLALLRKKRPTEPVEPVEEVPLDPELARQLRALGYLR